MGCEPVASGGVHDTVHEGVASLVISNPPRRNAMSVSMMIELAQKLRQVGHDPEVTVVVIRGDGDTFVAGADISEFGLQARSAQARTESDNAITAMFSALAELPKPLIAMIHGYCVGAGMAVALGADIRIAASDSHFAIPAARLGIAYPTAGVDALVRTIGPSRAAEMLFTGDHLNADQSVAAGLVNRAVPPGILEATVQNLARQLANNAPLSILAAKAVIRAGITGTSELRAAAERRIAACAGSQDASEGYLAFLEKRTPRFTGH